MYMRKIVCVISLFIFIGFVNGCVYSNEEREINKIEVNNEKHKISKSDIENIDVKKLSSNNVKATSTLKSENGISYKANLVFDSNLSTAWVEGKYGDGINESLDIIFDNPIIIKDLKLINGYSKNADIYYKNNRVKKIKVEFSNGEKIYQELEDGLSSFQRIDIKDSIISKSIKITILEVFKGTKYSDTAISEIDIIGIDKLDGLGEDEIEYLRFKTYEKEKIKRNILNRPKYETDIEYSDFTQEQATQILNEYIKNEEEWKEELNGREVLYSFEKTGVQAFKGYEVSIRIKVPENDMYVSLIKLLVLENGTVEVINNIY